MNRLKLWCALMAWGNRLGCHQLPERSFFFRGYQFPLCARCSGILLGEICGVPLYFLGIRPPLWLLLLLFCIMVLDGGSQFLGWQTSTNWRRLCTGALAGYASLTLLFYIVARLWL